MLDSLELHAWANSVGADEVANNEPPRLHLHGHGLHIQLFSVLVL